VGVGVGLGLIARVLRGFASPCTQKLSSSVGKVSGKARAATNDNPPPRTVLPEPPPPMGEVPPIALKEDYERGAKEPINP
jgi:hypothetical protein